MKIFLTEKKFQEHNKAVARIAMSTFFQRLFSRGVGSLYHLKSSDGSVSAESMEELRQEVWNDINSWW